MTLSISSPLTPSSIHARHIPPQLKSNTTFPRRNLFSSDNLNVPISISASIPIIPPSPSPVTPHRRPADRCNSPPGPATAFTALASVSTAENRSIAHAVRAAATRRNESPLPVPDTATARFVGAPDSRPRCSTCTQSARSPLNQLSTKHNIPSQTTAPRTPRASHPRTPSHHHPPPPSHLPPPPTPQPKTPLQA